MFKNYKGSKGFIIMFIGAVLGLSTPYLNLSSLILKIILILAIMLTWIGYFVGTQELKRLSKKNKEL